MFLFQTTGRDFAQIQMDKYALDNIDRTQKFGELMRQINNHSPSAQTVAKSLSMLKENPRTARDLYAFSTKTKPSDLYMAAKNLLLAVFDEHDAVMNSKTANGTVVSEGVKSLKDKISTLCMEKNRQAQNEEQLEEAKERLADAKEKDDKHGVKTWDGKVKDLEGNISENKKKIKALEPEIPVLAKELSGPLGQLETLGSAASGLIASNIDTFTYEYAKLGAYGDALKEYNTWMAELRGVKENAGLSDEQILAKAKEFVESAYQSQASDLRNKPGELKRLKEIYDQNMQFFSLSDRIAALRGFNGRWDKFMESYNTNLTQLTKDGEFTSTANPVALGIVLNLAFTEEGISQFFAAMAKGIPAAIGNAWVENAKKGNQDLSEATKSFNGIFNYFINPGSNLDLALALGMYVPRGIISGDFFKNVKLDKSAFTNVSTVPNIYVPLGLVSGDFFRAVSGIPKGDYRPKIISPYGQLVKGGWDFALGLFSFSKDGSWAKTGNFIYELTSIPGWKRYSAQLDKTYLSPSPLNMQTSALELQSASLNTGLTVSAFSSLKAGAGTVTKMISAFRTASRHAGSAAAAESFLAELTNNLLRSGDRMAVLQQLVDRKLLDANGAAYKKFVDLANKHGNVLPNVPNALDCAEDIGSEVVKKLKLDFKAGGKQTAKDISEQTGFISGKKVPARPPIWKYVVKPVTGSSPVKALKRVLKPAEDFSEPHTGDMFFNPPNRQRAYYRLETNLSTPVPLKGSAWKKLKVSVRDFISEFKKQLSGKEGRLAAAAKKLSDNANAAMKELDTVFQQKTDAFNKIAQRINELKLDDLNLVTKKGKKVEFKAVDELPKSTFSDANYAIRETEINQLEGAYNRASKSISDAIDRINSRLDQLVKQDTPEKKALQAVKETLKSIEQELRYASSGQAGTVTKEALKVLEETYGKVSIAQLKSAYVNIKDILRDYAATMDESKLLRLEKLWEESKKGAKLKGTDKQVVEDFVGRLRDKGLFSPWDDAVEAYSRNAKIISKLEEGHKEIFGSDTFLRLRDEFWSSSVFRKPPVMEFMATLTEEQRLLVRQYAAASHEMFNATLKKWGIGIVAGLLAPSGVAGAPLAAELFGTNKALSAAFGAQWWLNPAFWSAAGIEANSAFGMELSEALKMGEFVSVQAPRNPVNLFGSGSVVPKKEEQKIVLTEELEITESTAGKDFVMLSWVYPENTAISEYEIYRDGQLVRKISGLIFTDNKLPAGTYTYTVKGTYNGVTYTAKTGPITVGGSGQTAPEEQEGSRQEIKTTSPTKSSEAEQWWAGISELSLSDARKKIYYDINGLPNRDEVISNMQKTGASLKTVIISLDNAGAGESPAKLAKQLRDKYYMK